MPHDFAWFWPMWLFPMFMPIFWIAAIILILYFLFGRGRNPRICGPGPGPQEETALDPEKALRQRGDQQRRIRTDEAGYFELMGIYKLENGLINKKTASVEAV